MKPHCCLLLLILLSLVNVATATGPGPRISPAPGWVTTSPIDYTTDKLDADADDGEVDLLFDRQVSVEEQTTYTKKSIRLLTEAGVQNYSQVSVDYDPAYQQVFFHTVNIIRGTQTINLLRSAHIKTIQQEKELDRFIYDGSLSAVLILDDVRKGDVIEYSYSVKGFNPIFKNKYTTVLDVQYSVPVYHIYYKLICPADRTLHIKNNLTTLQPVVSTTATGTVYEWSVAASKALHVEERLPSWYNAYPNVMISEYSNWKEVAAWAVELYPFTQPLAPLLQKKVAAIQQQYTTAEARTLAALRFVQDDVRYMGIEMGQNSHKPHSPVQILSQRFGDCKDKAYLLCTLLKAMGIEAWPVLINTTAKKALATYLPSPGAFDHVTVGAVVEGKTYYFDATISYQRGSLANIAYPNYQMGLRVSDTTTALTVLPLQESGRISTREVFNVPDMHSAVKLKVVTVFTGSFADIQRYDFKSSSLHDIKKQYREQYSYDFTNIETDSLTYTDNETTGTFTTTEYYTILKLWETENGRVKAFFQPYLINPVLRKPKEAVRTMPYALSYPLKYDEEVEVHLPDDWKIDDGNFDYKTAAFHLKYNFSLPQPNMVLLTYKYEALDDNVPPSDIKNFTEEMTNAEKGIAFEISTDNEGRASKTLNDASGNKAYTAIYAVLGCCALGTYVYRRRRRETRW